MGGVPLPLAPAGTPDAGQTLSAAAEGSVVRRSVLAGGVRVLTESMPGQRSVTFGAWVGVGSRDEAAGRHGATHFLEHLLFKGTARRSAMDIASALDTVGGEANAATGKEHTCYYARVLDEDLGIAVDVITDMVTSATLTPEDVESERGVILEELAMNDDDPADVVHERFGEVVLGAHPLGRPIGGTPESISAVTPEDIAAHFGEHYVPAGLVFTAAGGVDHDAVCRLVEAELRRSGRSFVPGAQPLPRRPGVRPDGEPLEAPEMAAPVGGVRVVRRATEQANVVLGTTGITATDGRRYAMTVLNAVLGGGMSSRLFQEVRERRGLAYSVYSFSSAYSDAGYFGLYAGCTPGKVDEVLRLLTLELERLASDGLAPGELDRAHGQLAGGLVLGLEDSGSRMSRLGKAELVHGEYVGLDEALERIRAVTAEEVADLARTLAARPRCLTVVGPFDEDREFRV